MSGVIYVSTGRGIYLSAIADTGLVVLNIILGTTIISELLGPLILMP